MPILPLSAVAAANATQRADECTNKEIQAYLPSELSNFLDSDGEDDMTPPSSGKHSQHSLAAEDGDAQCNLDDVDDDSACHGSSAGGDDVDEADNCDAYRYHLHIRKLGQKCAT